MLVLLDLPIFEKFDLIFVHFRPRFGNIIVNNSFVFILHLGKRKKDFALPMLSILKHFRELGGAFFELVIQMLPGTPESYITKHYTKK